MSVVGHSINLVFLSSIGQVKANIRTGPLLSGQRVSKGMDVTKHGVCGLSDGGGGGGRSVVVLHTWRELGRTGAIALYLGERVCLERIVLMVTTSHEDREGGGMAEVCCVHV